MAVCRLAVGQRRALVGLHMRAQLRPRPRRGHGREVEFERLRIDQQCRRLQFLNGSGRHVDGWLRLEGLKGRRD